MKATSFSRWLLVAVVGLVLFSGSVGGETLVDLDPETDLDGNGTETDPYEIGNSSELQSIEHNRSANYTLVDDIDATTTSAWNDEAGFEPVGNDSDPFIGDFNGSTHSITELTINRTDTDGVGMFGVSEGRVHDVVLTDVNVSGGNATAGVVGDNRDGTVETVSMSGSVTASNATNVGGLVGHNNGTGESTVRNVFSNASVDGADSTAVGGLVGNNTATDTTIENAHADGKVDGNTEVGGLVGNNSGSIATSFATGAVEGSGESEENIGGLVGSDSGDVTDSYWDTDSTTRDSSGGGEGLTNEQMTGENATADGNMGGFAFNDRWIPTEEYPRLSWQYFDESTGDGTESEPYVVEDQYGLQAMSADLDADYELGGNINASDTDEWNDGDGFDPIGDSDTVFTGSFDGNQHRIEYLNISRPVDNYNGLFGIIGGDGSISEIRLVNTTVSGNQYTGSLVGQNVGSIEQTSSRHVNISSDGDFIGGLIGQNEGNLSTVSIDGNVSATSVTIAGGLVGASDNNKIENATVDSEIVLDGNEGIDERFGGLIGDASDVDVLNSTVTVNIQDNREISESEANIGGLIGLQELGEVSNTNVRGQIITDSAGSAGGLVGANGGSSNPVEIIESTSTVDVTAESGVGVGGLVGSLSDDSEVRDSSANGSVKGGSQVGGAVGTTDGNLTRSFATGNVTGQDAVGGFVGEGSEGTIRNSSAAGNVTNNGDFGGATGGFVGSASGSIESSYSRGKITYEPEGSPGGFVGWVDGGDFTHNYWDMNTSEIEDAGSPDYGPATIDGIEGLYTDEFRGSNADKNTNLAFNPVWIATDGYPLHVWRVDDYTLDVDDDELETGDETDSTVSLDLSDGSSTTATEPATYTSDPESSLSFDNEGGVTAENRGDAEIEAFASGFSDTVSLSVTDPPSTSSSSSSSSAPPSDDSDDDDGSDDDSEDDPEEEPEDDPEEESESTEDDSSEESSSDGDSEDDDSQEQTIESESSGGFGGYSPVQIVVGGGASAIGAWGAAVLFSRSELMAIAPASLASAVSSVPGTANFVLAEPEQAAFIIAGLALKPDEDGETDDEEDSDEDVDIAVGNSITIEATVENKGDVSGAREVTLSLEEAIETVILEIEPHTAQIAALTYDTRPTDAGKTLGFTVDCETGAADVDVTVGELTADDETNETMSETTDDSEAKETGTEVSEDEIPDEDEQADAEASEEELDVGTRTSVFDRMWLQKGKLLAYLAGGIILYIGATKVQESPLTGGLSLFLGFMALPIVRAQLPTSTRVLISRYGKVLAIIIGAILSGAIVDPAVVIETIEGLLP